MEREREKVANHFVKSAAAAAARACSVYDVPRGNDEKQQPPFRFCDLMSAGGLCTVNHWPAIVYA